MAKANLREVSHTLTLEQLVTLTTVRHPLLQQ